MCEIETLTGRPSDEVFAKISFTLIHYFMLFDAIYRPAAEGATSRPDTRRQGTHVKRGKLRRRVRLPRRHANLYIIRTLLCCESDCDLTLCGISSVVLACHVVIKSTRRGGSPQEIQSRLHVDRQTVRHTCRAIEARLTASSNAYYAPHKHSSLTTHLILRGQLTISYPDDPSPKKETFGPGAVVDVDAGKRHEVWMGSEGCTYVIGE